MKNKFKGIVVGAIISIYCLFSGIMMINLPNAFCKAIAWIGSEEAV